MKTQTRRRANLWLAWVYILIIGPAGLYVMVKHPELWVEVGVFAVFAISVETAIFTHFAASAADTPMDDDER